MIDYYSLSDEMLPMSMRVFRKMLKERGWKAEKLCAEYGNNLILTRPDGKELRIASSIPPTTDIYALRLADDKLMSYAFLESLGISQPETRVIHRPEDAIQMLEKYGSVVIKPVDGAHGRGVTAGITSVEAAEEALRKAIIASAEMKLAIIQPQLPQELLEVRTICIDYKFILAVARIPARVTGDGVRTIKELIELENATKRTLPYKSNLAHIDIEMAKLYLGDRMNEVPAKDEKVRVVASCNVGQGGTMEDYSENVTQEMIEISERIAKEARLPMIGVDFYGNQVIEINAAPALYQPTGGEIATRAVKAYIDYLEKL